MVFILSTPAETASHLMLPPLLQQRLISSLISLCTVFDAETPRLPETQAPIRGFTQ